MTPQEYKALYIKHDIVPAKGFYVQSKGTKCGCAIGIRMIEHYGSPEAAIEALGKTGSEEELFGFIGTWHFRIGLVAGFDDRYLSAYKGHTNNEDFSDGYEEGRAAREFLNPLSFWEVK